MVSPLTSTGRNWVRAANQNAAPNLPECEFLLPPLSIRLLNPLSFGEGSQTVLINEESRAVYTDHDALSRDMVRKAQTGLSLSRLRHVILAMAWLQRLLSARPCGRKKGVPVVMVVLSAGRGLQE